MGHNQLPDLGFDLLSLSLSLRQHQLNDPRNQVLRFSAAPKGPKQKAQGNALGIRSE